MSEATSSLPELGAAVSIGQPDWWWPVLLLLAISVLVVLWGYRRAGQTDVVRMAALGLKVMALVLIAACLLEPLWTAVSPRQGANLVVVLADNSRGMTVTERTGGLSRGEVLRQLVAEQPQGWLAQIDDLYDLRSYTFAETLERSNVLGKDLSFTGKASNLTTALQDIAARYRNHALAAVVVLSDGVATDASDANGLLDTAGLPPIYAVPIGTDDVGADLALSEVTVVTSNFEDAPVTLHVDAHANRLAGRQAVVRVSDTAGKLLEQQRVELVGEDYHSKLRFRLRPEQHGVAFYHVDIALVEQAGTQLPVEATTANNHKTVVVDRGQGPYRILYVAGRPNWDYKFLRRAVEEDDQISLVGLLRVAKREPKFQWSGGSGGKSNPLFAGANAPDGEQSYDKPVLVRLSVSDKNELADGFPRTPESLFSYHAVIIDDLEAAFFTRDQMDLIQRYVAERGGGLLMLGGADSLETGGYDHTPIGDALPVYTRPSSSGSFSEGVRLELTREGLLESWTRLRDHADAEARRLAALPEHQVLNRIHNIKPGASLLATARTASGEQLPALVAQRFGKGRTLAFAIGDVWRAGLSMDPTKSEDLSRFWRQTLRWLTTDVPGRLSLTVDAATNTTRPTGLRVRVLDEAYKPVDNAEVTITITGPTGQAVTLSGEPTATASGEFHAAYLASDPGAYRITAQANVADGTAIPPVEVGLVVDPDAKEFATVKPNRALLAQIAQKTGGRLVEPNELSGLPASLLERQAPVMETRTWPLWHNAWVLTLIMVLLIGEWLLRRRRGMA